MLLIRRQRSSITVLKKAALLAAADPTVGYTTSHQDLVRKLSPILSASFVGLEQFANFASPTSTRTHSQSTDGNAIFLGTTPKKLLAAVGFEPTPPKRLVP